MFKKNDILDVDISDLSYDGAGVAKIDGCGKCSSRGKDPYAGFES